MASGWKVACHSSRMIERCRVTSLGTLVQECENSTRDHNCKTMAFFFFYLFLFTHVSAPHPPTLICYLVQLYVLGRELSLTLTK